jgi:acyl-CoA thioesterase I
MLTACADGGDGGDGRGGRGVRDAGESGGGGDAYSGDDIDSDADAWQRRDAAARTGSAAAPPGSAADVYHVVFIGTSLTAGYGLGDEYAYPARIQERIDDAGLPFRVVNAGLSGETSAGGLRRVDWVLQQPVDVLVVELGANDGLRGQPPEALRANLDALLTRARTKYPDVALVMLGMEAPPNLGDDYTSRFRAVYRELAARYDAALVPFLLDGVAAEPSLNLADGVHPNERGHRAIAATVWPVLETVLRRRAAAPPAQPSSDDS